MKGKSKLFGTQLLRLCVIVIAVAIGFSLAACSNGTTSETYNVTMYIISTSTYNSLVSGEWYLDESFAFIKTQPGTEMVESESGYSIEDFKTYLRGLEIPEDGINEYAGNLQDWKRFVVWYQAVSGKYVVIYAEAE